MRLSRAAMSRWLPWIAMVVVVIGFVNFFWLMAESTALGGDALNGHVRDGHYYVTSHGEATEVSQAEWQWSRAHGISVLGTHLLAMSGMAYLLFRVFFPAMLPSQSPEVSVSTRCRSREWTRDRRWALRRPAR